MLLYSRAYSCLIITSVRYALANVALANSALMIVFLTSSLLVFLFHDNNNIKVNDQ